MKRHVITALVALGVIALLPDALLAQPSRQFPGSRPHLPGSPPSNFPPANSRVRAAANAIGNESTDFYTKNGYPKQLGDAVEAGSSSGGTSGTSGTGGNTGNTGVQSAGSGGFQGNTGNQIGQMSGGTILGGLFGFNQNITGGVGVNLGAGLSASPGATGGGFSGMVPKGFGFGGTSDFSKSWTIPMSGASGK